MLEKDQLLIQGKEHLEVSEKDLPLIQQLEDHIFSMYQLKS